SSAFVDMVATPGNGVGLQWRDEYGNLGNVQDWPTAPVWVKLVRQGDTFTGYDSFDGVNWYQVGPTLTIAMPTTALAGLAVTSHNDGAVTTATFTNVSLLPTPWSNADIGGPGMPGGATFDGTSFTVLGGGSDIWFIPDQFHFVYQPSPGDGAIIARVDSLDDTDVWAKAGVMERESTDPWSAWADVVITPGNGVAFQWRDQYGNPGDEEVYPASAPIWVELTRSGDTFAGYYSYDGVNWALIGSPVSLPMDGNA